MPDSGQHRENDLGPIDPTRQVVRVDWRIAVPCAVALVLLFTTTQSAAILGIHQSFGTRLVAQALAWGIWLALLPLVFAIAARAHARPITDWRNVAFQLGASIAVVLLHIVIMATVRWVFGATGDRSLLTVIKGFTSLNFPTSLLRYWLIAAVYHVIAYHREVRRRDVTQAHMAQILAESRLENLEARLQPHFLFNALNTIAALIKKDPPAASVMVGQLSELLRAALSAEVGREVTLAGELQLIDRYMAIQQTRFSDRLRFSVDAAPDTLAAYVPQMILQPIVENAVRHGIGPREAAGVVGVQALRHGAMLRLIVRDDGVGFGSAPASLQGNGLGVRSTRARLQHLYGGNFAFDIRAVPTGGTVVTIDVPFHTNGAQRPVAAS